MWRYGAERREFPTFILDVKRVSKSPPPLLRFRSVQFVLATPRPLLLTLFTLHCLSIVLHFECCGCLCCFLYACQARLLPSLHSLLSSTMTSPFSNRRLPANASGYELREQIGQGTCAAVYRAWCEEIKDEVAIKVVDLEWLQAPLEDIGREIQVMSLSSHPNVVPFSTAFVQAADLWIVMPLLTGGSVLSLMNCAFRDGLPEEYSRYVLWCVLNALEYFHGNGQLHRDVKAANLMLDSQGNTMLSDYGMMGWMVEGGWDRKQRQTFVGTPCWMAPEVMEQAEGYDYKADIWSLGITAIELAQGRAPYTNYTPMKVLFLTLQNPPPTLTGEAAERYSAKYKDFIRVCLQKDPKARPSAKQLLKHSLFAGGVVKPVTLAGTIAKLPPIGSRGGSQKQLFRQLQKVSAPQRSGIYDLSAKGLGWDFGDESDSQKTAESLAEEINQNRTPQPSPSGSSAASLASDSTLPAYSEINSVPEPQSVRNGSHVSFDGAGTRPQIGASASQALNSSAVTSLGSSRASTAASSALTSAMRQQPSSGPMTSDAHDSIRLGSSQERTTGINSVPAKTVGLLKKGRFTVSDVTTSDRLDNKLDSFLDFSSSSEHVPGSTSSAADAHPPTASVPIATLPQSAAFRVPHGERQLDTPQGSSSQQAAPRAPVSNGMRREDTQEMPSVFAPTPPNDIIDQNTVTSKGRPQISTESKPPTVRVVNVPNAVPTSQSHTRLDAKSDRSFITGVAPVIINMEPQQAGQFSETVRAHSTKGQPSIPIHKVPAPRNTGVFTHHTPDQNSGISSGTQAPTTLAALRTSDPTVTPVFSAPPVINTPPSSSTTPPTGLRPITNVTTSNATGKPPTIPSAGVSVTTIPSKPVSSPPSQHQTPANQKPLVPVVIPSSAPTSSALATASQTGNGSSTQSASIAASTGTTKKKSRFEVKDVLASSGKTITGSSSTKSSITDSTSAASLPPVSMVNAAGSAVTSTTTNMGANTATSAAPAVLKPKSRFEVKDVEQKPRQSSTTNGASALNSAPSAPSSANNSAPSSHQGTPIASPQPELVSATLSAPAKSALFLLTELQSTIQYLLHENETLKREVAVLRGQTQTGPMHGPFVGHRDVSTNEVSTGPSSILGAMLGQPAYHSQSADFTLTQPTTSSHFNSQAGYGVQSQSTAQPLAAPVPQMQHRLQHHSAQSYMQSLFPHASTQHVSSEQNVHQTANVQNQTECQHHVTQSKETQSTQFGQHERVLPTHMQHQQQTNQSQDRTYAHLPSPGAGSATSPDVISSSGFDNEFLSMQNDHSASPSTNQKFQQANRIAFSTTSQLYPQYRMQASGTRNIETSPERELGRIFSSGYKFGAQDESSMRFGNDHTVAVHSTLHSMVQPCTSEMQAGGRNAQSQQNRSRVIDVQLPSVQQPGGIAASLAAVMTTVDGPRGVMTQASVEQSRRASSMVPDAFFRNVQ